MAQATVLLDCEVVQETAKAVLLQNWFGSSADPDVGARTKWVPKSVASVVRGGVEVSRWFVAQNRLWDWQ